MKAQQIQAQNVTKPIQLLAAWLVGLIAINGSFLGAANVIESPSWAAGLLVIASVINVPLFLLLIFFLQTKFRAELQEDSFYSKHLDKVTGSKDTSGGALVASNELDMKKIQRENADNFKSLQVMLESVMASFNDIQNNDVNSELEIQVAEAKKKVSQLEINNRKFSVKLAVNNKMERFNSFSHKLAEAGFTISEVFGSEPPNCKTISYLDSIDKRFLSEIVKILEPFGFDRIDYDPDHEGINREASVYVGSYIDNFPGERRSIKISPQVIDILNDSEKELVDLNNYILDQ